MPLWCLCCYDPNAKIPIALSVLLSSPTIYSPFSSSITPLPHFYLLYSSIFPSLFPLLSLLFSLPGYINKTNTCHKEDNGSGIKIINGFSQSINRLAIGAQVVFQYFTQHHIHTTTLLANAPVSFPQNKRLSKVSSWSIEVEKKNKE